MNNMDTGAKVSNLNRITKNLSEVLVSAFEFCVKRAGAELNAKDVFLALISHKQSIAARLLERLGVDITATAESMGIDYKNDNLNIVPIFGEEAKKLLASSFLIASELRHVYVGTEHMLLAILKRNDLDFVQDLASNGFGYDFVKQSVLSFGVYQPGVFSQNTDEDGGDGEQQQTSLQFFARDMNKLAKDGKYLKVWGRDDEVERMIHILSRKTKNNPILVGEAGVGKTAIVEGFVQRIVNGDVPEIFRHKKVVSLDLSSIVAGSKIRGDLEERILAIVSEMASNPDTIIFIDEIHMIVGAGAAGSNSSMDIANILKPHLTSGDLRVIGATTYDEFQKYIEDDAALERRFQPIMVDELAPDDAKKVMQMLRPAFEDFHKVTITDAALDEAVELSSRYITNKYLPDKAIDVIDEASAAKRISIEKGKTNVNDYEEELKKLVKEKNDSLDKGDINAAVEMRKREVQQQEKLKRARDAASQKVKAGVVMVEDIRAVVARWSKVPVTTMTSSDLGALQKLDVTLSKRIVGQTEAIARVTAALKRARMGFSDEKRPLASFVFLGPTGVGKTETAKEIARTMFGSEDNLIQVDMSEYMEQHSISKLIGSPPGYVGFQEGGQLTEKIRRKPYSVILFDEIEKAHPELLNILLQILDEGKLKDSKGRVVNFKNSVIVMTSNIGASEIKENLMGFGVEDEVAREADMDIAYERLKEGLTEELKNELAPELINRIDEIIIFRSLDADDAKRITKLLISDINERLKKKGIQVVPTNSAVNFIASTGFDEAYGARNIRRKLQELVENPLADYLLQNNISVVDPADMLLVKVEKDKDSESLLLSR